VSGDEGPRRAAGRLWGGRFAEGPDAEIDRFTSSFAFDTPLAPFDLRASMAHGRMLWERGIIEDDDARAILVGLGEIHDAVVSGELAVRGDDEDVHSWIERTLTERIGPAARRLHTARSRNDQTAVALRLLVRHRLVELAEALLALLGDLRARAAETLEVTLPGYTHLQRGQPVTLAHHLLAHAWSLVADLKRLRQVHDTAGSCPLGAGALAGTPHPIDPARSAALLGFPRCFPNSMYAVADRDYVVETSFACALLLVHLSRWAEEVVLWTSREFGFAELDDRVAKGSSLMPQKKNPEPAEVLRGKSGRVVGDLVAHLMQLKGLPLTYNSDLQEDKEALFDALDSARGALTVARPLLAGLRFQPEAMRRALRGGYVTATDLADALVRARVPFRDAHERAGTVVREAERRGVELWELPPEVMGALCPEIGAGVLAELEPERAVQAHDSPGGPASVRVAQQLEAFDLILDEAAAWVRSAGGPLPIEMAWRSRELLETPSRGDEVRR
jgi:argininosuccinate lyase